MLFCFWFVAIHLFSANQRKGKPICRMGIPRGLITILRNNCATLGNLGGIIDILSRFVLCRGNGHNRQVWKHKKTANGETVTAELSSTQSLVKLRVSAVRPRQKIDQLFSFSVRCERTKRGIEGLDFKKRFDVTQKDPPWGRTKEFFKGCIENAQGRK